MIDRRDLAVAQGFVERSLEMDVEEGRPGAQEILNHFIIIQESLVEYERERKLLAERMDQILFQLRSR
jgi:hypothetical protein